MTPPEIGECFVVKSAFSSGPWFWPTNVPRETSRVRSSTFTTEIYHIKNRSRPRGIPPLPQTYRCLLRVRLRTKTRQLILDYIIQFFGCKYLDKIFWIHPENILLQTPIGESDFCWIGSLRLLAILEVSDARVELAWTIKSADKHFLFRMLFPCYIYLCCLLL